MTDSFQSTENFTLFVTSSVGQRFNDRVSNPAAEGAAGVCLEESHDGPGSTHAMPIVKFKEPDEDLQ